MQGGWGRCGSHSAGDSRHPEGRASGRRFHPLCPARCALPGCLEVGPLPRPSHTYCLPGVVLGSWRGQEAGPPHVREALGGASSGTGTRKAVGRLVAEAGGLSALPPLAFRSAQRSRPTGLSCWQEAGPVGEGKGPSWPSTSLGLWMGSGALLPVAPPILLSGLPGPVSVWAGAAAHEAEPLLVSPRQGQSLRSLLGAHLGGPMSGRALGGAQSARRPQAEGQCTFASFFCFC